MIFDILGIILGTLIFAGIIRKSILINPNIVQIVVSWIFCVMIMTAVTQGIFTPLAEDIVDMISENWKIIVGSILGVLLLFYKK